MTLLGLSYDFGDSDSDSDDVAFASLRAKQQGEGARPGLGKAKSTGAALLGIADDDSSDDDDGHSAVVVNGSGAVTVGEEDAAEEKELAPEVLERLSKLPPSPKCSPTPAVQEKFQAYKEKFVGKKTSFNTALQCQQSFHNPYVLATFIAKYELNDSGTLYPTELYDPDGLRDEKLSYKTLELEQKAYIERLLAERQKARTLKPPAQTAGLSRPRVSKWGDATVAAPVNPIAINLQLQQAMNLARGLTQRPTMGTAGVGNMGVNLALPINPGQAAVAAAAATRALAQRNAILAAAKNGIKASAAALKSQLTHLSAAKKTLGDAAAAKPATGSSNSSSSSSSSSSSNGSGVKRRESTDLSSRDTKKQKS